MMCGNVFVPIKNGKARIKVVSTQLNNFVCHENLKSPSVHETRAKLTKGKFFSKFDANSGFWQVPLGEESKLLTPS